MVSIILLSCVNFQTGVALYLFNILRPKDKFEKALNAFLIILFIHLVIKLSLLVLLKNNFLYNNNSSGFGVAYGPLLYLTTLFFLSPNTVKRRTIVLHMAPLPLFTLVFFVNSAGYLRGVISPGFINTYSLIYQLFSSVSLIIYPLVSWHLLNKRERNDDPQTLHKLKLLDSIIHILLTGILLGLFFIISYYAQTGKWDLNPWILTYICFLVLLVLILRYKMETVPSFQKAQETVTPQAVVDGPPDRHYKKSALDETKLDAYEASIRAFMEKSKIYLEPEISLEDLSESAKIPKHHITQLLNERFHKNFYTFINEYRIQEAVTKLKDPGLDINILSLAYDCGFNSKSSFNSYFKKITGLTPSGYRKKVQENIPVTIQ
ncbi:helix-turn-helix domain-containing protein [Chitinophaga sp. RAB17]|uniref:helix-turn-helix domain-containing protein n=1 Tax=Chitinophaga sp. RAB17 TaxID=3233049 RepID=UPI003F8E30A0